MTSSTLASRFAIRGRRLLRTLLACALLITLTGPALTSEAAPTATTWHVTITGNDNNNCLSIASACRNIKRALDKAASGDTIVIGAGTFFENLDIAESLTLQGAGANITFIDGSDLDTTIVIAGAGENIVVTLTGLTVQNGRSGGGLGGGFLISGGTVNLADLVIISNIATVGGGGIYSQSKLNLTNVILSDNISQGGQRGGGLYNLGNATLTNVVINNNSANLGGGIGNAGTLTLIGSTISNNHANEGGGIYNSGPGARFTSSNNQYVGNYTTSASGGAIYNAVIAVDTGSLITGSVASTGGGGVYNLTTGQLTLNGTTLRNNRANSTFGGGLHNDGQASLTDVTVRGNTATSANGGGIYSSGMLASLTLANATVADNSAVNGGGVYASTISGTITVINSQLTNNLSELSGGGLYATGPVNLSNLIVTGNRAVSGSGGGVYASTNSRLTAINLTLKDNAATGGSGGGLYNDAQASANGASINNNQAANGGGVYNANGGQLSLSNVSGWLNSATQQGGGVHNQGNLTLTQSSLYSNTTTVQGGSGLYNSASARLINVTVSYNRAISSTTGALLNDTGTLSVLNSTISQNSWPALVRTGGTLSVTNSIIVNSTGGNNCDGVMTSGGYNMDSGVSCGLAATGDVNNVNPVLGALQNNGGSTPTRGLPSNSPAVDAANNATCPPTDQRGVSRPQGAACDIGAYEVIGYNNGVTQTIGSQICVTSSTLISSTYRIGTAHVGANMTFEPRSNLRVNLHTPDGQVIHLLGDTGGAGQNLDVLWDDSSPFGPVGTENHDINVPFYKYVRVPDESLAPLSGLQLTGAWKLEVCNVATGSGTLNRWSLIVPEFSNPKVFLPLIRR